MNVRKRSRRLHRSRLALPLVAMLVAVPVRAPAQDSMLPSRRTEAAATDTLHADAETDPTAFVLSGYSLHLGLGAGHLRFDLGPYAIDIPEFLHGNHDFDVRVNGFRIKAQWFILEGQVGPFVGVDGGWAEALLWRLGTSLAASQTWFGPGVNAGWRIALPAGFHVTPWIGIQHDFGTTNVTLAGSTFRASAVSVFPAVHLGYRFQ
jgi:hypothetical protein